MQVLQLNRYGNLAGGVEAYAQEVSDALVSIGWESYLLYKLDEGRPILPTPAEQVNIPEWPEQDGLPYEEMARVLAEIDPDIALVHAIYNPYVIAWLANRVPTLAYVHGAYPVCPGVAKYHRKSRQACTVTFGLKCMLYAQSQNCCWGRDPRKHYDLIQRTRAFVRVFSSLDTVLVGSHYMAELLVEGHIKPDSLAIVPPLIIPEPKQRPNVDSVRGRILFAGRLVEEKGLAQLLLALLTVDREYELLIAGSGPELSACQDFVKESELSSKVQFLGQRDAKQMKELYLSCSFVVMPSLWPEPFGRVGPEAAANARPVIAYEVGGIAEWVEDGVSGFLVKPGDIKSLSDRITQLLDDPDLSSDMGRRAQTNALRDWSREKQLGLLVEHFNRVAFLRE